MTASTSGGGAVTARRSLLAFVLIIWAMSSMLYAHVHHWDQHVLMKEEQEAMEAASLDAAEVAVLRDKVSLLEIKETALRAALARWKGTGSLPPHAELVRLGVSESAASKYDQALLLSPPSLSSLSS
mmetsp:Transcript_89450/g.178786  ORF Transcript_89450/g.178786 Transcript_89450/m.178786 type:complete len:127 (+) Transcript_89450:116-496(+)